MRDVLNDAVKIGLYHPLGGIANPKYKLQHYFTTIICFTRDEGSSF